MIMVTRGARPTHGTTMDAFPPLDMDARELCLRLPGLNRL